MTRNKRFKNKFVLVLALVMALSGLSFGEAKANTDLLNTNQTLRVLLRRLGIEKRMDITINGSYTLESSLGTVALSPNTKVVVLWQGGKLYVYTQGAHWIGGQEVKFVRHSGQQGQENGLRLQEGESLYEGDLALTATEEVIEHVLYIHVEDYLLGVVPYEMSDSFPLEALKAQAIAARTYAINKVGAGGRYDLVDTTNDQVFKGKNTAHTKAAQAVQETAGICGAYQGRFANCYYTASNGGQTDLANHVWGGENPGYIIMQDDPYDYKNPKSPVRQLTIAKNPTVDQPGQMGLRKVLAAAGESTLRAKGYTTNWEHFRIDKVTQVSLQSLKYEAPSRLYTQITITFYYSGKTVVGSKGVTNTQPNKTKAVQGEAFVAQRLSVAVPTPTPFFAGPPIDEEIDFFQTPQPQGATNNEATQQTPGDVIIEPTPSIVAPTADPNLYSDFIKEQEPLTLTIDLFPADQTLGLSINQSGNELIELKENNDSYVLSARRFGHGVGMSQRGAEQMGEEGKTHKEILAFYYPKMELITLPQTPPNLVAVEAVLAATPGPMPTPTPRPTLMPVDQPLQEGWRLGVVTNIEEDSTLNLRAEPSLGAEVVLRLYKGQKLIILPTTVEQGWYHVKTDVVEGYVSAEFIEIAQE